jgi:hypothetical protein
VKLRFEIEKSIELKDKILIKDKEFQI